MANNLVAQYQNKTNELTNRLIQIRDNSDDVYGSTELQQRYNIVNNNENAAMQIYRDNKENSFNNKIDNLGRIMDKEITVSKEDINFLKKSTSRYNEDFNSNLVKLNYIDKEIMTKERIIMINEDDSFRKERTIYVLKAVIIYLTWMILPVIFYVMGLYQFVFCIILIVVLGIITAIIVTVNYFRMEDPQMFKYTRKTAKEMGVPLLQQIDPSMFKKCPKTCYPKPRPRAEGEDTIPGYGAMPGTGNEVWLDNSENRWIKGDVPTIGATYSGYQKIKNGAEPKPYYVGAENSPQYKCRWGSDPNKMTNMNKGVEFVSNIPCQFYPGYETAKYN